MYRKIWRVVIIGYEMPAIKLISLKNGNVFIRNTRGHWKNSSMKDLHSVQKGIFLIKTREGYIKYFEKTMAH